MRMRATLCAVCVATTPALGQVTAADSVDTPPLVVMQRLPRFPFASYENHVYGIVIARYVVDTGGGVDPATITIVSTPDTFMARAVRKTIRETRFHAGILDNHPVAVLVEQSFVFEDPRGYASSDGPQRIAPEKVDSAMRAESVEVPPVALFSPPPRMPGNLRVRGTLLVRFIIDTAGQVEPSSVKFLNSHDERLTSPVRDAVLRQRYRPAMVHGRPVRILVERPFMFGPEHSP